MTTWDFAGFDAFAFEVADAEAKTVPATMARTAAILRSKVELISSPYAGFCALIEQKVGVTHQELMKP